MEKVCKSRQKSYRFFLLSLICAGLIAIVSFYLYFVNELIPDRIYLNNNSIESIDFRLPFWGKFDNDVSVNLLNPVSFKTGDAGTYELDLLLFDLFPVKKVNVNVCNDIKVIPCGIPVGIYIETNGVMVVDIGNVTLSDGTIKCPASDLIWPGDYIMAVNGKEINSKEALVKEINELGNAGEENVILKLFRNGEEVNTKIKLALDENGKYRIGVWVRDDCQGLGTLTYIDSEGNFGALGHGICDIDTGKTVNIKGGKLYGAKIWAIVKGVPGNAGEVVGSINYDTKYLLGDIAYNNDIGIYGTAHDNIYDFFDVKPVSLGYKQDIEIDKAYVRSFVNGVVKDYEIYISSVDMSNKNINKGISFVVVDEELISLTGGIVQGMSGSPIIQNGNIIGAVTHVLVNDPTKGYGIFIENMLEQ